MICFFFIPSGDTIIWNFCWHSLFVNTWNYFGEEDPFRDIRFGRTDTVDPGMDVLDGPGEYLFLVYKDLLFIASLVCLLPYGRPHSGVFKAFSSNLKFTFLVDYPGIVGITGDWF
jgi:hypothetical protein